MIRSGGIAYFINLSLQATQRPSAASQSATVPSSKTLTKIGSSDRLKKEGGDIAVDSKLTTMEGVLASHTHFAQFVENEESIAQSQKASLKTALSSVLTLCLWANATPRRPASGWIIRAPGDDSLTLWRVPKHILGGVSSTSSPRNKPSGIDRSIHSPTKSDRCINIEPSIICSLSTSWSSYSQAGASKGSGLASLRKEGVARTSTSGGDEGEEERTTEDNNEEENSTGTVTYDDEDDGSAGVDDDEEINMKEATKSFSAFLDKSKTGSSEGVDPIKAVVSIPKVGTISARWPLISIHFVILFLAQDYTS